MPEKKGILTGTITILTCLIFIISGLFPILINPSQVSADTGETLTVTYPNGGETWYRGTDQTIIWTSTNLTGNVKIELSLDGGASWNTLAASYPNEGHYEVYVGAPVTDQAEVRVSSVTHANTSDVSDATFIISNNSIIITSPNSGEIWRMGQYQSITWTQQLIGTVDILISRNNGDTWVLLAGNMALDGQYSWQANAPSTNQALIMVRKYSDHSVFDVSDASFTITDKYIILTVPNGGETWKIGNFWNITWEAGGIEGYVDIDLSRDGGQDWQRLIDNTPNDGMEGWWVSGPATTSARVRVRSRTDASLEGVSQANFTIAPANITLTSPNGGQTWAAGSVQNITWQTASAGGVIDLEISRDGGTHWASITAGTPDDGVYEWLVTGPATNQALIKAGISGQAFYDPSDAVFTITADASTPMINVVSPNGGESWNVNSTQTITWTSNAVIGNVNIDVSYNSGTTWSRIATDTPNDGGFLWKVTGSTTWHVKVRVASIDNLTAFDVSDDTFTIVNNAGVNIASPNGGEFWEIGSTHAINWYSNQVIGNVKLELCRQVNGIWEMITASTEDDGTYDWTVNGPVGPSAKFKVTSLANTNYYDSSDAYFYIVSDTSPYIIVGSPNTEVKWQRGTTQNITWTASSMVGNVNIALSRDGGSSWADIITNIPNDGSEPWVVTGPGTWLARIKIYATANPAIFDDSDSNFFILPYIILDWPINTLEWTFGTPHDINWYSMGVNGSVGIDISRNGGTSWVVIAENTLNDGRYDWAVTGPDSTNVKFRVRSLEDPTVFGICKPGVSIIGSPSFSLSTPNGGESWAAGSPHAIVWSAGTLSGYLKIELLKGSVVSRVIHESTEVRPGTFVWNTPSNQTPGSDYRIRVTSTFDAAVTDTSDNVFSITSPQPTTTPTNPLAYNLNLISPNGGESWLAGNTYAVAWQSNLPDLIRIDLMQGDTLARVIESGVPAALGIRSFTISTSLESGSDYRVEISSLTDTTLSDLSDNYFSITNPYITTTTTPPVTTGTSLSLTSPNGGEAWVRGQMYPITWESNIPGNVRIDLLKGNSLVRIISSSTPASAGMRAWTIPTTQTLGTDYKVRITSLSNSSIKDSSEGVFSIVSTPPPVTTTPTTPTTSTTTTTNTTTTTTTTPTTTAPAIPFIIISTPNGGETWPIGSSRGILWGSDNLYGDLNIDLSRDGGATWTPLASDATNNHVLYLTVTGPATDNARIRISSALNPTVYDMSDSDFVITAVNPSSITLTSPNGGENWAVGSSHNITWTTTAVGDTLVICVSYDGGSTWNDVVRNILNTGTFNWSVTGPVTNQGRIKIYTMNDINLLDISDANFTITESPPSTTTSVPYLTLNSPDGGETFARGQTYVISWESNIPGNVRIDLYKGNSLVKIISSSTPASAGMRSWTIPTTQAPGTDYRVRITCSGRSDVSDNYFTIAASAPQSSMISMAGSQLLIFQRPEMSFVLRFWINQWLIFIDAARTDLFA